LTVPAAVGFPPALNVVDTIYLDQPREGRPRDILLGGVVIRRVAQWIEKLKTRAVVGKTQVGSVAIARVI
jgi:hypothetical protein